MDKIKDSGSLAVGSIPAGGTDGLLNNWNIEKQDRKNFRASLRCHCGLDPVMFGRFQFFVYQQVVRNVCFAFK